jgi:membrane fusion protein (multidrug efflux system)
MVFFINAVKYLPSVFPHRMSTDPSNSQKPENSLSAHQPGKLSLNQEPTPPKRPKLVVVLAIMVAILFLLGIGGWKAMQISQAIAMGKSFKMPPDAITSLKVSKETVAPVLETVGSLSSPQGVMLSADLPGIVTTISFESGSHATNGQLLVQLDTRQEEAQLRTAKAKLDLARQNLDRAKDLSAKHVIAQSAYDETKSQYDAAVASVDETRAMIDRKTIRAPFDGFIGIRQINAGQYVKSGDPIVQLESLDPIYVNYALPQQNLAKLRAGQPVQLKADGIPDKVFMGSINAINSAVDATTRNIQIQATIPNPDHVLRSGMFAGVQVVLPTRESVVMVPATAVQFAPYGDSVFVIKTLKDPQGKEFLGVHEVVVTLGKTRGDQIEIVKGLSQGDEIATSGIFKLHEGGAVKVENSVQPGNNPAPKPTDS